MYVPFAGDIKYMQQTNELILKAILNAFSGIIKKLKFKRPGFSRRVADIRKFRFQEF